MPKFAANLTMMFNEVDFLDRFEAAARSGFHGVEYLFPYAYEKEELVERLQKHALSQVLHNLPAGDWASGERGIACYPDRVGEFQEGVGRAIEYATALGCKQINCLAGVPKGVAPEKANQTLIDNLKFAANRLGAAGIRLLIEPINTRDIPGFFLCHTQQAVAIIDAVGSNNLWLQYDIYHMQIMDADHGGRSRPDDRKEPCSRRPLAARRQPGSARAWHGRNQLSLLVPIHRQAGIRGLDRL